MDYKSGALCLVVKNSKILMVKIKRPGTPEYFTLPGGGIEKGETPEQAAIRELKEDVSLETSSGCSTPPSVRPNFMPL